MNETKVKVKKQKSAALDTTLGVLFAFAIIIALCFSMVTLFSKRYFGRFFVNGQSMYPTLNKDAKDKNGNLYGEKYQPLRSGSYDIDYGIYDSHERIMKNINRFDIVICRYLQGDATDKIKRIIVLPGETFYLTATKKGEEGNGLLYVQNKETEEFELIEQPIDDYYINGGEYPVQYTEPYTLGENEYFVMGDNRGGSNDSRVNGPIDKSLIEGKVIALVAKCSLAYSASEGQFYPDKIDYFWPRFF